MPIPAARLRGAGLLLCATVLAAGCASESLVKDYVPQIVTPYRIDIQQGNFVTQDMVDKLQVGQTRDQVRFILGTPLLTDVFHAGRWDYVFRSSKGWREPDKHKLTVYFENEKLARWESDVPPAPVANLTTEEPGFFGRLLGSKPAEPAPAAARPTAAVTPPPPAVGSTGNVTIAGDQPVPPPPQQQAAPPAIAPAAKPSDQGDKPEEKPGVVRRMFGWLMPGTGLSAASPEESRAASPDPAKPPAAAPNPPQAIAQKPEPQPEPAPTIAPPSGTVSVGPPVIDPTPIAPPPAPVVSAATATPVTPPPAPAPAPAPPTVVAQAAPVAVPAPQGGQAPPAAPPPRAAEPAASPNEIISAIEQWRNAWQDKDATRYLSAYAPDFKPAAGLTRAKWEAQRRDRLSKPSFIIVRIVDPQVTLSGSDAAVAIFVQEYESSILKESGRKTLKFGNYGGKWLIREETMPPAR
jgi:outer membrane protein assembly factor BamE